MAQSQSFSTDLPLASFMSVLTLMRNRSTTRPYQQSSSVTLNSEFLAKRGRGSVEDIVHPHFVVVAPERPAVDKLHAEKVLVPDIQAAVDLNLRPFKTASSAQEAARSPHNAPHQPSNLMPMKLIVPPVCGRQLDPTTKPVAVKVVQVTRNFAPKIFENRVFNDVV